MGEVNTAEEKINSGSGAAGQVKISQGANLPPVWGALAAFPSGGIIIWAGTIANIPSGWVICDGNNSTPNLLARFVEGVATAATNPGATGGSTAKTSAEHFHWIEAGTGLQQGAESRDTTSSDTVSIADIRPLYYDVAFLMKT